MRRVRESEAVGIISCVEKGGKVAVTINKMPALSNKEKRGKLQIGDGAIVNVSVIMFPFLALLTV